MMTYNKKDMIYLRRQRLIKCHWNTTPKIRRVMLLAGMCRRIGNDHGHWYYNCIFSGVNILKRSTSSKFVK